MSTLTVHVYCGLLMGSEVPELRIYAFWDQPVGPHPIAMFEVNLFTPAQFGAFVPWLVINRGPLSVLIHPNTVDPVTGEHEEEERDHTQRASKFDLYLLRYGSEERGRLRAS